MPRTEGREESRHPSNGIASQFPAAEIVICTGRQESSPDSVEMCVPVHERRLRTLDPCQDDAGRLVRMELQISLRQPRPVRISGDEDVDTFAPRRVDEEAQVARRV